MGGLPEQMQLELIEPLRELFKDEVREVGEELGLPDDIVWRQPFPGPGLAVRVLGEVTEERARRPARGRRHPQRGDPHGRLVSPRLWQSFAVLLPVRTVGVMGDERTYDNVIALRAVDSRDGMTADWARLALRSAGAHLHAASSTRCAGVNRVVYDISSKPPATIEWE